MMEILNYIKDYGQTIITFGLLIVTWIYAIEVKHQSKAMMQQIGRDLLAKKYEKLTKEMTFLVGPLYTAKDSYLIIRSGGYNETSPYFREHHSFWDNIKKNMYLAQPDLFLALNDYFSAMSIYRDSPINENAEHTEVAIKALGAKADTLIQQIDISYKNLLDEIKDTDTKFNLEQN